jgi:uncharacterized membrane protein
MKKCFLTGLVTLLPVAITVWLLIAIIHFLTNPFMGIVTEILRTFSSSGFWSRETTIRTTSEVIILFCLFCVTWFLGFLARRFFFKGILTLGDRILFRIPLVNKVYKTSKEIVQSLFSSKGNSFKRVVLVSFPYKGSYCLGLVANDAPVTCNTADDQEMSSVFIPTAPNPMTGFLVMIPKQDIVHLEMTSEQAMKYVVSCAVIPPPPPSVRP